MKTIINKFFNQPLKAAYGSGKPLDIEKFAKMRGLTKKAWEQHKEEYIKQNSFSETEIQDFDNYFSKINDIK